MWLLTAPPLYEGPATEALTPAALATRVLVPEAQGAWVVLLQVPWHGDCVNFAPAFADLARTYGGGGGALRFATLDLARWPGLAQRYGVDLNGAHPPYRSCCAADRLRLRRLGRPRAATTSQLPTVVLYEGGAEVDRLPRKKAGGGVAKGRWKADDVVRIFDLPKRAGVEKGGKAEKKRK